MLCLIFFIRRRVKYNIETPKTQNRVSIHRYNKPSLLKRFRKFLISDSYGLSLEVGHLNGLWFAKT